MGCTSCASGGGTPRGCQNNGTCSSGGCNKLGVFDWLGNMDLPSGQTPYDIVEVRFKNSRKSFYRNNKDISLQVGDVIVVEASPGYDVGVVSVIGELARIQVKKKAPGLKPVEAKKIYRIANQEDIDKWSRAAELEKEVMYQSRTLAVNLNLNMKISDVEYQGDLTKATFYYTSEDRVDFRQLIKDMADQFKIRIEMRQIGSRQEAARLGGIGSCGRELCCSTWLTDFRSVSTSAARYQQLSLNPQKLAGQCGKLKCCLNFELDMYLDAIKSFPSIENKLYTEKGAAFHIKTDIFKRVMVYMYEGGGSGMISLSPERVAEIREMNIKKQKPQDLIDYTKQQETVVVESEYANVDEQDNLNRFDNNFKKGKKKRKPARPQGTNPNQEANPNQNPNAKPKKVEVVKNDDGTKTITPAPKKSKPKPKPKPKPLVDGEKTINPVAATPKDGEEKAAAPKKNKRRRPPRKDGPKTEDNSKTNE
ncbi:MAG: regulatory iron-sulfur-containing complex subunit RicT [Crocinitomicaceae bacterium]|nr:regulatory iron-sulfur-containing complex subunit RicT [Crocinitomicaceae bacterium]